MRLAVFLLACILAIVSTASAQILPGTTYDPAIPTLETVVGHKPGEEVSTPDHIGRYLEALSKAAPDRTRLVKYATTWEGRPLHYLIVGSRALLGRAAEPERAFLMHQPLGGGHVIAFAEDPNCRAFADATTLLFMNAVLLGPGH